MNDKRHEVFISYSSKDSNIANHLVDLIESKGIKCWLAERDIPEGATWDDRIPEAIHSARIFIVIISNNSVNSTQVPREIRLAVDYCEAIYPIRIDNVKLKGSFEYYLSGYQWTDVTSEQHDKLEKFSNALQRYMQDKTPIPEDNTPISIQNNKIKSKKSTYIAIAAAAIIVIGGLLFRFISTRSNASSESNNAIETSATINNSDNAENTDYIENNANKNDDINTEDAQIEDEKPALNVPGPLPTQSISTEDVYYKLGKIYEEMIASETQPVDMTKYLTNLVNTDIDNDGIDEEFLFTKADEGYYGTIDINLSSGNTLSWNVSDFSDTFIAPVNEISPVDISAVDINKDGVCEVLFKQEFGSTGGVLSAGLLYVFSDGIWNSRIFNTTDSERFNNYKVIDMYLLEDSVIVLTDKGMKDGPFQYFDYIGEKYVISRSYPQEIESSKSLAKEYWPYELWNMDSGNYADQDFTVTDECIDKLKKELDIPSDAYVTVTVSGVLYYERRNVYLKQVLFEGDGIYNYTYVDKYFNQIDFNRY